MMFGYGNIRLLRSAVERWLSLSEEDQFRELEQVLHRLHAVHSLSAGPDNSIKIALDVWTDYLTMVDTYRLLAKFNGREAEVGVCVRRGISREQFASGLVAKFTDKFAKFMAREIAEQVYPIMLANTLRSK